MELQEDKDYYAILISDGKLELKVFNFKNISVKENIITLTDKVPGMSKINLIKSQIKSEENYINIAAFSDNYYWYNLLIFDDVNKAKKKFRYLKSCAIDLAEGEFDRTVENYKTIK